MSHVNGLKTPAAAGSGRYIPAQFPARRRSQRSTAAARDDLDNSCTLSDRSIASTDGRIVLLHYNQAGSDEPDQPGGQLRRQSSKRSLLQRKGSTRSSGKRFHPPPSSTTDSSHTKTSHGPPTSPRSLTSPATSQCTLPSSKPPTPRITKVAMTSHQPMTSTPRAQLQGTTAPAPMDITSPVNIGSTAPACIRPIARGGGADHTLRLPQQDVSMTRPGSPSCIPNHLSSPSLAPVNSAIDPEKIEIEFQVESGYSFNPLHIKRPNSPATLVTTADRAPTASPKLKRTMSARASSPGSNKGAAKGGLMKMIKKAKGSIRGSPASSRRSSLSERTCNSPSSETIPAPRTKEQSLIRVWTDQVEGGVEGYKGFLIAPDTTARELLTTIHRKLALPGSEQDFFLCAKFFNSSVSDRPLMDTDRPLYLHHDWNETESYRFELRQKPRAIMLVFGDAELQRSACPLRRGAVEVAEDATTSRVIAELVNKYHLDPCQRYLLVERHEHQDKVLRSTESPVMLQRRWLPFENVRFVLIQAPNTPEMYKGMKVSGSYYYNKHPSETSFTSITPFDSLASQQTPRLNFAPSTSSVASGEIPDFRSAESDRDSLNHSISDVPVNLSLISNLESDLGDKGVDIGQQRIRSGFEAMQNQWMGADSPPSSLGSIEEHLFADLHQLPAAATLRPPPAVSSHDNSFATTSEVISPRTKRLLLLNNTSSGNTTLGHSLSFSSGGDVDEVTPCSDSGVNVSDCNSYRPMEHEVSSSSSGDSEDSETLEIPIVRLCSPSTLSQEPPLTTPSTAPSDTPKLSAASVGQLQDMSWDNFDIDRSQFQSEEEYLRYVEGVREQAALKQRIAEEGLLASSSLESSSSPENIDQTIGPGQSSSSSLELGTWAPEDDEEEDVSEETLRTLLTQLEGDVGEMAKQDANDADDEESPRVVPQPEKHFTQDHSDGNFKDHDLTSVPRQSIPNMDFQENSPPVYLSPRMEVSESMTLLDETRALFSALEEKTGKLQEMYFSPDKMEDALRDPLGSIVSGEDGRDRETPVEILNSSGDAARIERVEEKEIGNKDEEILGRKTSLISRSIEFFEKLSSANETPLPLKARSASLKNSQRKSDAAPAGVSRSKSFTADRRSRRRSVEERRQRSEESMKSESVISEALEEPIPTVSLEMLHQTECFQPTDLPPEDLSSQTPEKPPKKAQEKEKEIQSKRKDSSSLSLSQPSITTLNTETSHTSSSTAKLRESVDKLRFEIDDMVNCCGDSFTTSLDTERHNFSDSVYERVSNEGTLCSSGESVASSEYSNPVYLEQFRVERGKEVVDRGEEGEPALEESVLKEELGLQESAQEDESCSKKFIETGVLGFEKGKESELKKESSSKEFEKEEESKEGSALKEDSTPEETGVTKESAIEDPTLKEELVIEDIIREEDPGLEESVLKVMNTSTSVLKKEPSREEALPPTKEKGSTESVPTKKSVARESELKRKPGPEEFGQREESGKKESSLKEESDSKESEFEDQLLSEKPVESTESEVSESEIEELFLALSDKVEVVSYDLHERNVDRGTVGIEVTYHSDQSDSEYIHYHECEISSESPSEMIPVIEEPVEIPDVNSILILTDRKLPQTECFDEGAETGSIDEGVPEIGKVGSAERLDDFALKSESSSLSALSPSPTALGTSVGFHGGSVDDTFPVTDADEESWNSESLVDTVPSTYPQKSRDPPREQDELSGCFDSDIAQRGDDPTDLDQSDLESEVVTPSSSTTPLSHVPGCENAPLSSSEEGSTIGDDEEGEDTTATDEGILVNGVHSLKTTATPPPHPPDQWTQPRSDQNCDTTALIPAATQGQLRQEQSYEASVSPHPDQRIQATTDHEIREATTQGIQPRAHEICEASRSSDLTTQLTPDQSCEVTSPRTQPIPDQSSEATSPRTQPMPDQSYGAAYDELTTSDSETSESEDTSESDTLSGNYRRLCRRLKRLNKSGAGLRRGSDDSDAHEGTYEIKLPRIAEAEERSEGEEEEEEDEEESPLITRPMIHADLKRQYRNLLAEIEETKPKLRQLEVLQSELTSMQKAYHDLKEQALRMSIEQDAQKSQIEAEINKLKVSNQELINKNKDGKTEAVVGTIMELEKLYSNRISALETALRQKDEMVKDLEEQNKNMMTQLNVTRRQSVQLETANELLHKRNEVLVVEKQEGEINPAQFFDSDNEKLALLAKQCDALQQTVNSLESTLVLRVKELNETYEDLDIMKSDLRAAEVARIEAEAQLDVNKREVERLKSVNENLAEEIKQKIAENGRLEQENRHLSESLESLQLQYDDTLARVGRLENALLAQEKALEAYKNSEASAKGELTKLEKELEVAHQAARRREEEVRKLRKEVEKAKKGSSMYNLCNVLKPGETLELVSVDLPAITQQLPRGIYLREGQHGVYVEKVDAAGSAGRTNRLRPGDRVVEINLADVSNGTFDAVTAEMDSPRALQLVVARVAPDVRIESKLRAEALKDQLKGLVGDLDKTAKHCQGLQEEMAKLKDELAGLKAKQRSELGSASSAKNLEELQNLRALLAQKEQYLKTLETTVRTKNELLVTMEMESHRNTPRQTPNSSLHNSFSPGLSSTARANTSPSKGDINDLVNKYG